MDGTLPERCILNAGKNCDFAEIVPSEFLTQRRKDAKEKPKKTAINNRAKYGYFAIANRHFRYAPSVKQIG